MLTAEGKAQGISGVRGLHFTWGFALVLYLVVSEVSSLVCFRGLLFFQKEGVVSRLSRTDRVGFSIPAFPSWLIFSLPLKDDSGFQQKKDWLKSSGHISQTDFI